MPEGYTVRPMTPEDIDGVVALQAACFPPPFSPDLHWKPRHIAAHLRVFPEGQLVAVSGAKVIASATNARVSEERWDAHGSWMATIGGPMLEGHDPEGQVLVGLDIAVHPEWRGKGVARALYEARFQYVRDHGLRRYGTACRLPGFEAWHLGHKGKVEEYAEQVSKEEASDRTMTPLLKCGLSYKGVIKEYMEDIESGNAAAILEWQP